MAEKEKEEKNEELEWHLLGEEPFEVPELKPCPFCGGDAKIKNVVRKVYEAYRLFYFVECSSCLGTSGFHLECYPDSKNHKAKKEAAQAWNRRADNG